MSGWTPGPWKRSMPLKGWDGQYNLFEIHWSDDGECVAEIVHGEADARLIAAAPELADALGSAFYTLTYIHATTDDEATRKAAKDTADEIEAALAKARGETA